MPISHDSLPDPPRGIYRFIEKMKSAESSGHEKRTRARHAITAVVVALPINAAGEPAGEAFKAVTRDLSTAGLSLLHTRMVKAKFLAIEILNGDGNPICAHLEVIRCQAVGQFYLIAGSLTERFVARAGTVRETYAAVTAENIESADDVRSLGDPS